jgi:hypothetical protein
MFPFDNKSELNIKAYLEDNILNNLTRLQYSYNPENGKVYSRHLVKNTPTNEWEEDGSIKLVNN